MQPVRKRKWDIVIAYIVRTPLVSSSFTRLRYCSRNCIRPKVPKPTAARKPAVHAQVTTRPMGKKARFVPGRMNGAALATAADAEAAAAPSSVMEAACWAKTPLTKDASWEESVVVTTWPEEGLFALSSI